MQIAIFKVQPIDGAGGAITLAKALEAIAGVSAVDARPDGRTTVKYDDTLLSRDNIDAAVLAAGFAVAPKAACCGGCGG